MGKACCSYKNDTDNRDVNFSRKGRKNGAPKVDSEWTKDIPLFTVIKFQAIIRGYLARRRVKKIYGFERTPGMLNRGRIHIEMDPEQLQ